MSPYSLQDELDASHYSTGLPSWLTSIESTSNAEDMGSVLGLGRFPGEGNGNPLQ